MKKTFSCRACGTINTVEVPILKAVPPAPQLAETPVDQPETPDNLDSVPQSGVPTGSDQLAETPVEAKRQKKSKKAV